MASSAALTVGSFQSPSALKSFVYASGPAWRM